MDFIVTDRSGIEDGVRVRSSYIVISVHDPDRSKPKIKKQPGLRGILHLAFHDAEPIASGLLPARIMLMAPEHAKQIIEFAQKHRNDVGAVVVHCEAGMSRSPAIAAALCKIMGEDDRKFWKEYQPNLYVYRLVMEAGKASWNSNPNA